MSTIAGTIFDVKCFSIHDEPGIRTTVFVKGCALRCACCHNLESQARRPELLVWPGRCILLVVTVVAVLLAAAAALTWRSAAVPAVQEPVPGACERQADPIAASVPEAPVPGGPGFVMLDPCAFRAKYPTTEWVYYYDDWQLYNPGAYTGGYLANLVLPNNVTITQMVVYFYDNRRL